MSEPIDQNASSRALDLVRLPPLMERTEGRPEISVALVDGTIAPWLVALSAARIREVPGALRAACADPKSFACEHGTIVASILAAARGSAAPAICPGCTLLVRSIFPESTSGGEPMPSTNPEELASAVRECIEAGARVINLSLAVVHSSPRGDQELGQALDTAAQRGVIVVAAAGNQGTIGSSALTRHPWVIPVVGCDLAGTPLALTNLASSAGRRGLCAPGTGVVGLGADGSPIASSGTSISAPLVTGAIALLWSEFPRASAGEIKLAIVRSHAGRRARLVPPLLDASKAYTAMREARSPS